MKHVLQGIAAFVITTVLVIGLLSLSGAARLWWWRRSQKREQS